MSNEIKQGDKVRVSKDAPELYTMYGQTDWESVESTVEKIDGDAAEIRWFNENSDEYDYITIPSKYLVKVDAEAKEARFKVGDKVIFIPTGIVEVGIPYDNEKHYWNTDIVELFEPTERTEAEKKPNVGSIKIPVEVDLTDSFWDAYTADLAREVALKVANKYNDTKEAAEYAVSVAKAVVEGLKRE